MLELNSTLLVALSLYIVSSVYILAMAARAAKPPRPDGTKNLFFVLVVPALNEELVIGNTVRHLLSLRGDNYLVMVVDDGSDDQTAAAVEAFQTGKVRLVPRRAPFARLGKGAALNYAYEAILTSELPGMYGEENIIVAVMDADGQVETAMLEAIAPYFVDPRTGAVQTGVRMLNANDNLLTRWQQYEFVTFNWIFSRARDAVGSGSLGGNGQFVRLSALASLGGQPWTDCLTEDLDLGLRLMLKGWRNHYCHEARVYQQAVVSLRRLVRQRSRWYQGHLSCWRHIPRIIALDMPAYRKADVLNYLLAPALVVPMGIVSILGLGSIVLGLFSIVTPGPIGTSLPESAGAWIQWYALGLGIAPLFAYALWRDGQSSVLKSLFWAHVFIFGSYLWFAAALMAYKRMLSGKVGWIKTARTPMAGGELHAMDRPASRSRFLAGGSQVRWIEGSSGLLPIRPQNFEPSRLDDDDPGMRPYEMPLARAHRPSEAVSLARAEAQLRKMRQQLELNGVAVAQPAGAGERKAVAETETVNPLGAAAS